MLDAQNKGKHKVLLRTWDDSFDWNSFFTVVIGGCFQTCIYLAICLAFNVAKKADLNIGISQAIWAINPFFISILERLVYNVAFNYKHVYGMSALVLCAICVSLSDVVSPPESAGGDIAV